MLPEQWKGKQEVKNSRKFNEMCIEVQLRFLSYPTSLLKHTYGRYGNSPALRLMSRTRPALLPPKESLLVPEVSEKEQKKKLVKFTG